MPDHEREQPSHARAAALAHVVITRTVLLASEAFAAALPAQRVADAIARGLQARGLPAPERCPLTLDEHEQPKALLDALGFDARMHSAHAVIVAAARLSEQTLDASLAFEIATRARQAGVPAYAVTANNQLDAFDARILDLQLILEAADARALAAAGRTLADLL